MKKEEHTDTGDVSYTFSASELKKIKTGVILAGAALILSVGTAVYAAASMGTLRSENELYKNQLKMADQKMEALEEKTAAVEKIASDLSALVQSSGIGQTVTTGNGGTGGASTVPDQARTVAASEHGNAAAASSAVTPGDLLREMRKLDEKLDSQIKLMMTIRAKLLNQSYDTVIPTASQNTTVPDMWPVKGEISSGFGFRQSPGGIGSTYHEGVDIAGDFGTPIMATASGVVTQAGWVGGYGYLVEIKHDNGYVTRYGHNSALLVTVGQEVAKGTVVSLMGSTGNSTGPHCHYEVRINGDAVNPMYFLPANQ